MVTIEKVNAISTLLESFGNSETGLNKNASRYAQILALDFDQYGMITSASIQVIKKNY